MYFENAVMTTMQQETAVISENVGVEIVVAVAPVLFVFALVVAIGSLPVL
tara:strand:- start:226 stop:375 length:150 start_codon:yes stop_codon:yes gene_type:complete